MIGFEEKYKEIISDYYDRNHHYWIQNSRIGVRNEYLKMLGNVKGKTILDLGCGCGIDAGILSKRGASGVGVDLSYKSIDYVKNMSIKDWEFINADSDHISAGSFDFLISSMEIMYHMDLDKTFSNYAKHCINNSKLLLVINNPYLAASCFRLVYEEEVIYEHKFLSDLEPHKKIHRPLMLLLDCLKKYGFRLIDLKEIFSKSDDCKIYSVNNSSGLPEFIAILLAKS